MADIEAIVKSCRDFMRQDSGTGSDELRLLQLGWMVFLKIFSDKELEEEALKKGYRSIIPAGLRWGDWAADAEGITGDELLKFVDRRLFADLKKIGADGNARALLVRNVFSNNHNYMKSGIHLRQVINKLNEINFNNSQDQQVFGRIYETFLGELQSAGTLGEFYTPRAITRLLATITKPKHGEKILDPACGTGGFLTAVIEYLQPTAKTVPQRKNMERNVMGCEYKPLPHLLANTNLILHDISLPAIRFGDSLARPLSEYSRVDKVDLILANPPFGGVVSNNNELNFPQNLRTKESADLFLILMIHLLKDGGRAAVVLPDGSLTGDGVKERIRKKLLEECDLHTIVRLPNSVFKPYAMVATNLLFFEKGKATKKIWYWEHQLPEGYKSYSKTKPIQYGEFDGLRKWWGKRKAGEQAWQVGIEEIAANGYNLDIKNPNRQEEEEEHNSAELIEQAHQSLAKIDNLLAQLKKGLK